MHIAIAGNIGAGKTTLTEMLASHYNWEPHFEDVLKNPYLDDFYERMERWSFNLQIYFLNSRFNQMLECSNNGKNTGETKQIGQYTCYKATYEKEVQEVVFSFGSQAQGQNNKKTKKVEVVAWFTPEIPVATGPSWYQGLPGLILEVSDDKTTILCTKLVMNPNDKSKIKRPKRGKVINNVDFVALQDQKRQEAREMWQRGQRSRGGSWR